MIAQALDYASWVEGLQGGNYHREHVDDPERCDYFVPVKWLHTVPVEKAVKEIGLFGNQNTVCRPTTPKWRLTVERLKLTVPGWATGGGEVMPNLRN